MRQPGQPVCRARRGSLPGSCFAARARIEPQTHSARTVYRSRADFAGRRRGRTLGQRRAVARAERVAAIPQMAHPLVRQSGCECLRGGSAAGVSQRIPLWRGSGAGRCSRTNPYEIVKAGSDWQSWAANYRPRRVAGRADCHLRGAGHVFDGGRAWAGCARCTSNFGFRAAEHDAGGHRPAHGRLQRRSRARDAEAHDRRGGDDSRCRVGGIGRTDTLRSIPQPRPMSSPIKRPICGRRMPRPMPCMFNDFSRILPAARTALLSGRNLHLA